ncbi:MAG: uracil-DNA glycosylase family protein [Candidatus Bathyarchaeia archaeon]
MAAEVSKDELMEDLARRVEECRRCPLYASRRRAVVGEGSLDALVMFVGEAPGYYEDLKGRPFVGAAGKVLDRLLDEIGLRREEVYITNIVKSRPPKNRDPQEGEIEACSSYLDEQLEIIKPRVVAPLGRFSTKYIMIKFGLRPAPISRVHGRPFDASAPYGTVVIFPLYHPAVALYRGGMEEVLFGDIKRLGEALSSRGYI